MKARLLAIKGYFAGIHRIRHLLVALIALVIADGVITHFLVKSGIAQEVNPFLRNLVGNQNFLVVKVVGVLVAAFILWDIYKRWPRAAVVSSWCFVGLYAGIITWNLSVSFIT